jgi:ATP-binding cassette, subfamily B, bacterial HlyB/CyaB
MADNQLEQAPSPDDRGAIDTETLGGSADLSETRLRAVVAAARFHGTELDRADFRRPAGEPTPSPAALVVWLRDSGLWAKATRLRWRNLLTLTAGVPVVLLFRDGSAGLLIGGQPRQNIVWIKDPRAAAADPPVAVDELRLSQVWTGEVILVRRARNTEIDEAPFNFHWLARIVMQERGLLRGLGASSIAVSLLTIVPPLLVMVLINQVIVHRNMSTLSMIALMLAIGVFFETLLTFCRREFVVVLAARIDTKLNLHIFNRLLRLPLDYFERNQAGKTTHEVMQIFQVREFMTGRMMTTFLDLITLFILLPVLFILSTTLAWFVLAGAVVITLCITAFLPALRQLTGKMIQEESRKNSVLVESIYGVKTVKSMALEDARRELWDDAVASAGSYRLKLGRLARWPQTIALPIERFIERGVLVIGGYMLITGSSDMEVGALIAFMLLGARVAQPLISLAHLVEELETVRASIGIVGSVLNQEPETRNGERGLRPRFEGAISVSSLTFTYPLAKSPALEQVTFDVPAGTMLGMVGRSGSGKSTIARLLQGINRDYSGFIKLDGTDLREINLQHLRRSYGVVLQDNFLFRGSVTDNIIANRPGLTLDDVVRAARLAGAEEFIERLPKGYETWVEEGSPNLSGGQKQRLAIARALISDPRILILDEATSALDPESEALVNANLTRIARGRTMIIVSHRLSSLVDCDSILVLEKGTVADMGPHKVLVERCAVYRQLWLQQNRHMEQTSSRSAPGPVLAQGDD